MSRNPFSGMRCLSLEERRKHVQDVHLNFPIINEDVLPDYLIEKFRECKQAFLEYYWELSKEKDLSKR